MSQVHVEQIYTSCLAEASYFIASNGEAAVVDPLRDPAPYLELAAKHNATIKYVFETHFHADFVSGHVDLAKAAGAAIVYGPSATPTFDALIANDGEVLKLGDATLTVLHTPGHTLESSCFLLKNADGKAQCAFTGDTLFIDDVGRPDLAQIEGELTKEGLAAMLFKSLRTKIMTLDDDLIVYPAHGAGSPCGKAMSNDTSDTLGSQKLRNYALRADMTEAEFVAELLEGQSAAPAYFAADVAMNKNVNKPYADIQAAAAVAIPAAELETMIASGTLVFDMHSGTTFCEGHVPKTQFAGGEGMMALWIARTFPDVKQAYAVVADNADDVKTIVDRLIRVGFDNCVGHLDGGVAGWTKAGKTLATIGRISAADVAEKVIADAAACQFVDVRGGGEFKNVHLDSAVHRPLCGGYSVKTDSLDTARPAYVCCAAGYRAVIYASNMLRCGYAGDMAIIDGGFSEVSQVPSMADHLVKRVEA